MKRRFLVLCMALGLMFALLPGTVWAVSSGSSGTISWVLDDDGTLTFSGTGEITNTWLENIEKSKVKMIVINEGITVIGSIAFAQCNYLESINIPNSVTSIGDYAFMGCNILNCVDYSGTQNDWNNISIGSSNQYLTRATMRFDDIIFRNYGDISWTFVDNTLTISGTGELSGSWKKYVDISEIKTVIINNGITGVGQETFYNCTALTAISIPESVIVIGDMAFQKCTSLESINIPNSINCIGYQVFLGCNKLKEITLPEGLTSIGANAFWGCSSLTNITIPDSVTDINSSAFYGCVNLISVTIPNGVDSINDYTFAECSNLRNVTIPDMVTSVGEDAFYNCSSLTSIVIPDNVTDIGKNAFCSCNSLRNVTMSKNVTLIMESAFFNCDSLADVYFDGLQTDWEKITIGEYNEDLLNAIIHFSDGTIKPGVNTPDNPDTPDNPEDSYDKTIFNTNTLPGAVKYVPYWYDLNDLAQEGVYLYGFECENLPAGLRIYTVEDDTKAFYITGVPMQEGDYIINLSAIVADSRSSDIANINLHLTVGANTDNNVSDESDNDYPIIQRVPNMPVVPDTDQLLKIDGAYANFIAVYLDGRELTRNVDYTAEEGSTVITIKAQVFKNLAVGRHTIAATFREGNRLKRAAHNFTIGEITSSGGGSHRGSTTQSTATVEPQKPVEPQQSVQPELPVMNFADVPESAWFYNAVLWAYNAELMQGNGDGTFGPNEPTSPAALVTVLARLADVDLAGYAVYVYDDIPEGMWYSDSAKWAKANGLLGEYVFEPDAAIARGRIAQTLLAYLQMLGVEMPVVEQEQQFADSELMTAEENVAFQVLYALGIFQGNGDNSMNPQGATTRAELAALLNRVSNALDVDVEPVKE